MKLVMIDPRTGTFTLVAENPKDEMDLGSFASYNEDKLLRVVSDNPPGSDNLPKEITLKP